MPIQYIQKITSFECWQAIIDSSGGNVGSVQRAVGASYFTKVIADDEFRVCNGWCEL